MRAAQEQSNRKRLAGGTPGPKRPGGAEEKGEESVERQRIDRPRQAAARLALAVCLTLAALGTARAVTGPYDYPFDNRYISTVIGTPLELQAPGPALKDMPFKTLKFTVFPDREIPDALFYTDQLKVGFAPQKKKAPLVIIIAGTGADHRTGKVKGMTRYLWQAGFHVLTIPSPTHPNFLVTASTTMVPGNAEGDAHDLYRVMKLAWEKVKDRVEVTEFYLTGYSLGAFQSAFVAKLDEQEKAFNFKKVLMVNPPLSLFNSVSRLDKMLLENLPDGEKGFQAYLDSLFQMIADYYRNDVFVAFDEDLFYNIIKEVRRKGVQPTGEKAVNLIGFAFRISSSNMIIASDIMTKANLIVPRDVEVSPLDSMNDVAKVAFRTPFVSYFDELFLPYFQAKQPGLTRQQAIDTMSLRTIFDYLGKSTKIGLIHNADDVIMEPGEVDELAKVFGSRAQIYPKGGHCGNMEYPDNVAYMTHFFGN